MLRYIGKPQTDGLSYSSTLKINLDTQLFRRKILEPNSLTWYNAPEREVQTSVKVSD